MSVDRYPWLKDEIDAYKNINFSSSTIIEGESGLANKSLLNISHKHYCALMN